MSNYIHLFETQAAHDAVYNGSGYQEPWTALVTANNSVSYNIDFNQYKNIPLTFDILSDGTIKWIANRSTYTKTIEYKKNNGEWTQITSATSSSAPTINVVTGDVLQFRGDNAKSGSVLNYNYFGGTSNFAVKGNIMSLLSSTNFENLLTLDSSYTFYGLFRSSTRIIDAGKLILPATTLSSYCYYDMFYNCTNLEKAPKELPATTLGTYCYYEMFKGTKITNAPELPAMTLTSNCYYYMFQNCTSLTKAPELPATTLVADCYRCMFIGCSNLSSIVCLATDISASNCCDSWVDGVAASGTFTKAASMTSWPSGASGIPTGWTVQDAS